MKSLLPREYEDLVERVLLEMDIWRNATVYRNKRFPGVRQAGSYEVDIALYLHLTELVSFLLIVECKNYTRPVTRPVVQQLAQTRDAIAAQKGAIVSPVGFSAESGEVARDLGIALWVMGQDLPTNVVMAGDGVKIQALSELFLRLRASYLDIFGLVPTVAPQDYLALLNFVATSDLDDFQATHHDNLEAAPSYCRLGRKVSTGSAFFTYQYDRLFDHQCAANYVVRQILATYSDELLRDTQLQERVKEWRDGVGQFAKKNDYEIAIVQCVEADDWPGFYSQFDRFPPDHWGLF